MSSLDPVAYAGSWNQVEGPQFFGCTPPYLPLASRPDVLVFQTEPLREPVQIVGPIEAELWVATDGPDTDFTAKLIDVHPPSADYPGGYAMNLTDGILRLRYAEDPSRPRLRQPGEVVRVRITLFPTANFSPPATASGWMCRRATSPSLSEPQHRRAGGAGAPAARGGEHGVRGRGPAEQGRAAGAGRLARDRHRSRGIAVSGLNSRRGRKAPHPREDAR